MPCTIPGFQLCGAFIVEPESLSVVVVKSETNASGIVVAATRTRKQGEFCQLQILTIKKQLPHETTNDRRDGLGIWRRLFHFIIKSRDLRFTDTVVLGLGFEFPFKILEQKCSGDGGGGGRHTDKEKCVCADYRLVCLL